MGDALDQVRDLASRLEAHPFDPVGALAEIGREELQLLVVAFSLSGLVRRYPDVMIFAQGVLLFR
jgi:hypothetical protein